MRAGRLDKSITVQQFTSTLDDYGTPTMSWSDLATVRAQIVQATTEEFIRGFGASEETAIIFRIRHLDNVDLGDRISFGSKVYNIKELKEIGRRKGLELRCVASGGSQ